MWLCAFALLDGIVMYFVKYCHVLRYIRMYVLYCRYHFLHGFDHMVIYLDYDNPKFTAMILESLHKELLLEKITLFYSFPLSKRTI